MTPLLFIPASLPSLFSHVWRRRTSLPSHIGTLRSHPPQLTPLVLDPCSTLVHVCVCVSRYQAAKGNGFYSLNYDWDNQFMGASALLQLMQPLLTAANGGSAPSSVGDAIDFMGRAMAAWQKTDNNACPTNKGWAGNFNVSHMGSCSRTRTQAQM